MTARRTPVQLIRENPEFRRLFLAHSASRAGDAFNTVALVILVFRLTGSGLGVAVTVAFEVLPILLLGPLVGVVVDRYPRRSLMVGADLARAMLALILAIFAGSAVLAYGVAFGLSGFGLLLGAIGLGAVGGPLLLGRFIRPGDRRWLFGPFAVRGGVDLAFALVASPLAAAPILALYGIGTSTGMVAYQSTLQQQVPSEVRGRAFAFYDVLWNAARLASLGLGGLLADPAGIQAVYLLGGILLLIAFAVGWSAPRPLSRAAA